VAAQAGEVVAADPGAHVNYPVAAMVVFSKTPFSN
jgi:hypothetical protein